MSAVGNPPIQNDNIVYTLDAVTYTTFVHTSSISNKLTFVVLMLMLPKMFNSLIVEEVFCYLQAHL